MRHFSPHEVEKLLSTLLAEELGAEEGFEISDVGTDDGLAHDDLPRCQRERLALDDFAEDAQLVQVHTASLPQSWVHSHRAME